MNFEVLKRSHVKRNILIGVIIVLILSAIILTFTRAKYRVTKSLPLVNGTINYELSDFNLIGAYIQAEGDNYTQVDEIPTSGYEFNAEKSYCTVNNENINATLNYDIETQTLSVIPLTTKGTKCYLYFDEHVLGGDVILASGNAPTEQTTDWTNDGQGVTYYYTGNPNNWVQFGGFWWRIIRINGDGSIRMIYSGTNTDSTTDDAIGVSSFNSSSNNNMYVGYMYGSSSSDYNTTHANINSSTIKGTLDQWYQNNLLTNYGQYIDGNAGFCGDRRVSSGTGTTTNDTYYQAQTRIANSSPSPSLTCETLDIYTTSESSSGNKALTYPIGLITADEVILAGIPYYSNGSNDNNYLTWTQSTYWTMTPSGGGRSVTTVFDVWGNQLSATIVTVNTGVRPVINLRADVALIGSGTTDDPFRLAE